jgi:excisionase family DNA binding protein
MSEQATAAVPLQRLFTAAEVAKIMGVTTDRIWELSRAGRLPTVKLGQRTLRYRPDAVAAAIEGMER